MRPQDNSSKGAFPLGAPLRSLADRLRANAHQFAGSCLRAFCEDFSATSPTIAVCVSPDRKRAPLSKRVSLPILMDVPILEHRCTYGDY